MTAAEYRVQVRVRNNYFLRQMYRKGFSSQAELARACGVNTQQIYQYVNLTRTPIAADGEWREDILKISAHLQCVPNELFPERHLRRALRKNAVEKEVNFEEMQQIASAPTSETLLIGDEIKKMVHDAIADLEDFNGETRYSKKWNSKRAAQMLRAYYLDGKKYKQIAEEYGLSNGRVREIIAKAESWIRKKIYLENGQVHVTQKNFEKELLSDLDAAK
jgi:DNA-directed RNA polymerase sigma subunit (sigma70/sigma32)